MRPPKRTAETRAPSLGGGTIQMTSSNGWSSSGCSPVERLYDQVIGHGENRVAGPSNERQPLRQHRRQDGERRSHQHLNQLALRLPQRVTKRQLATSTTQERRRERRPRCEVGGIDERDADEQRTSLAACAATARPSGLAVRTCCVGCGPLQPVDPVPGRRCGHPPRASPQTQPEGRPLGGHGDDVGTHIGARASHSARSCSSSSEL